MSDSFEFRYQRLTEDHKKSLCALALRIIEMISKDCPDMATKPSIGPIRFVIRGTSFHLKISPKSKLKKIPGLMGKALLLALLQRGEGKPLLEPWGFRFRKRSKANRLIHLNSEIKSNVDDLLPGLDLHIKKQEDTFHPGRFDLQWAHNAKVCDPVHRADSLVRSAGKCRRNNDVTTAFRKATKAVIACSLYYPAYQECLDCTSANPKLAKDPKFQKYIQRIIDASKELQEWLEYLKAFDFDSISKEFHEDIKKYCIAETDARLEALKKLRGIICGSGTSQLAVTWRNPANQVLIESRQGTLKIERGLPVFISDQATSDFQILLDATRLYIQDSDQYEKFKNDYGIGEASKLLDRHLVVHVLVEVAGQNKCYYFPEPSRGLPVQGTSLDNATIQKTAIELGKQVLKLHFG